MGAKNSSSGKKEYACLLSEFLVVQESQEDGLKYLESKNTQEEFLLREINCHDEQAWTKTEQFLKIRQGQLKDNKHIVPLLKIIVSQEDQFCMTFYKIFVLWEFPQRTLEDEINQRILQKRRFQEKELWSILASCILGLSHLQKEDIKHNALRSGAILISPDGIVKLYDPVATGVNDNYHKLLAHRSHPHLYISPEQSQSLREQRSQAGCDPYKTDIWTLGMILLQAGLLSYQDQCYRDQYSRIHWDTLQFNINRFQQSYSPELTNLLEFMLAKDERARPDWAELEQHVIKVEENADNNVRNPPPAPESENILDRIFAAIKPTSKINPFSSDRPSLFDKKPLSMSKVQSIHEQPQWSPPPFQGFKPAPLFKPSDISATRPLRNIFPSSFYRELTRNDENTMFVDDDERSLHQKSRSNLEIGKMQKHKGNVNRWQEQSEYVTEVYSQGSRYEGYKINGAKNGFGKFYYQDGGRYEGQWVDGRMEGQGKLFYQSEKIAYDGEWKNDQFCGRGVLYNQQPEKLSVGFNYKNFNDVEQFWTKYEGDFIEDMKHGRGVLFLSNGQFYEGQFRNDFVQGRGVFTTATGVRIEGVWRQNLML